MSRWAMFSVAAPTMAEHKQEVKRATRNSSRAKRRSNHVVQFISLDGEADTCNGQHVYSLLGCGKNNLINRSGLEWAEVFEFLYEQYSKNPSAAFTGFFLGYDFGQWYRSLPEERASMLLKPQRAKKRARTKSGPNHLPFPVRYQSWEFDTLGSRRLRIRPEDPAERGGTGGGWMYICDTAPFFQSSFLTVIDPANWKNPIVTPEEWEILKEGKENRADAALDDKMIAYNNLENDVHSRVMEELNHGFHNMGIHLSRDQWFGPGQAAQVWMAQRPQIPTMEELTELVPQGARDAAQASYYGGWAEIMMHGHIPGVTYGYDINSAYPYIVTQLPCLRHGKWEQQEARLSSFADDTLYAEKIDSIAPEARDAFATVNDSCLTVPRLQGRQLRLIKANVSGSNPYIGTMLHRMNAQNIVRPDNTRGWYWQHEVEAAIRAGLIDTVEVSEYWTYTPCDCEPPLREVNDLYTLRKNIGKTTAQGKAAKLVYNSIPGKFAQYVNDEPGKYTNYVYASLVISGCRTQILNAIATHPEGPSAVVMVATDGVYFRSQHPGLTISEDLGEWSEEHKNNLTVFKPGMYWDDKTRSDLAAKKAAPRFKSRGVNAGAFSVTIADMDTAFKTLDGYPGKSDWPVSKFIVPFSMITPIQALQRHDWSLAGQTGPIDSTHNSDPSKKRDAGEIENGIIHSRVKHFDRLATGHCPPALPYDKSMSVRSMVLEADMLPDDERLTPDGRVLDYIRLELGME